MAEIKLATSGPTHPFVPDTAPAELQASYPDAALLRDLCFRIALRQVLAEERLCDGRGSTRADV
eukprot:45530-Eustigmatos_ZCMA.PRE.1